MKILGTLALAISLSAALPAAATTYYVRTDGSDLNTGLGNSPAEAFATVQHAADLLNPGDVVRVQEGAYAETVTLNRPGAVGSPIAFNADGDVVGVRFITNVAPGAWPAPPAVGLHAVIDGFHFLGAGGAAGSSDAGIHTQGVVDLTIQNCTFELLGAGVYLHGAWATQDRDITLRNNTFRDNATGIDANATSNVVVEDCTFTTSNTSSVGIYSGWGMSNSRVERCTFTGGFAGVWLSGSSAFPSTTSVSTRIAHSTFAGSQFGVRLDPYATSNTVVNDTFVGTTYAAVAVSAGETVANNVFLGNRFAFYNPQAHPIAATNNLFWQNGTNLVSNFGNVVSDPIGTGGIVADPMLVDPANGNFAPRDGSPCIEAGDPAFDADPARRGPHVDIGAVEWIDTLPPSSSATLVGAVGANGWYASAVTAQLRATDAGWGVKEIRFALDGAAEVAVVGAAADVAVTTDGPHTLAYRAVDLGGTAQPQPGSVAFKIDRTAPAVAVNATPTTLKGTGKAQAVSVTVTASDATSGLSGVPTIVVTNASGASVATATGTAATFQLLGTKGQKYTITATARDAAGNAGTGAAVVTVK